MVIHATAEVRVEGGWTLNASIDITTKTLGNSCMIRSEALSVSHDIEALLPSHSNLRRKLHPRHTNTTRTPK